MATQDKAMKGRQFYNLSLKKRQLLIASTETTTTSAFTAYKIYLPKFHYQNTNLHFTTVSTDTFLLMQNITHEPQLNKSKPIHNYASIIYISNAMFATQNSMLLIKKKHFSLKESQTKRRMHSP